MKLFAAVLTLAALSGCCKQPQCPDPVQQITTVVQSCELPPGPGKLQAVRRAPLDAGCPDSLVCYEVPAAAAIAERNSKLVQWIRETKKRCAAPKLDAGAAAPVDSRGGLETSR